MDYLNYVYNRDYNLKLRPNNFLVSPLMKMVVKTEKEDIVFIGEEAGDCHFIHAEGGMVVALSHCSDEEVVRVKYQI